MRNCCYFLVAVLLFCIAAADSVTLAAADKNEKKGVLSLTDIPPQGAVYSFQYARIRKDNWQMKIPGISKASAREDALALQSGGIVRFLESGADQFKIEFEIGMLSAVLNGRTLCKIDTEKVSQVITVRKDGSTDVQLKKEAVPEDNPYQQILGVDPGTKKVFKSSFSDEQVQKVLKFIFRYPKDSMADYAGKNNIDLAEKKIPVCIQPLQKILQEKELSMGTGRISGEISAAPKQQFRGINVYPLSLSMESSGIPGWDFQYHMSVQYSADGKNIPVSIHRRALEITDRNMPWDETLYAGNSIQVIRSDETEISMIPWE